MAASKAFVEFLQEELRGVGPIAVRRMFGGAGVFANGIMFALIADDTLYFKADEATRAEFETERMQRLQLHDQGWPQYHHELLARARAPVRRCGRDGGVGAQGDRCCAARRQGEIRQEESPEEAGQVRLDQPARSGHWAGWVPSGTDGRSQVAGVADMRAAWLTAVMRPKPLSVVSSRS